VPWRGLVASFAATPVEVIGPLVGRLAGVLREAVAGQPGRIPVQ
jgi:hypothetical protein